MEYKILPSILSANLLTLHTEVEAVLKANADMIHFDVMDNHYVPNLTFGPMLCQQLHHAFPKLPLDVHLMVSPVDELIEAFAKAGAHRISIHPEATKHLDRSLTLIRELGCQAGLALNPATSLETLPWCHNRLDFILVMTVNPGFGGQQLIPAMISKISMIHQQYPHLPICVDGGIDATNIASIAQAGATQFVAGSAIFNSENYAATINTMHQQLGTVNNSRI